MKKYIAEFIGTLVLVTLGCGTAMLVGCDAVNGGGYILTALAFGLVIVGMAYCVGNISGCHINPAVSLGVLMSGGMTVKDFAGYVVSQCLGALAGAGLLAAIFGSALYGIGIGIVLSQGSTTGGTDIMGRLIQYVRPHWKIGKVLLGVDFFVVFLSLITFKTTEAVLYGIIALFISTNAIDWLMKTLNISKLAFVVTDRGTEISDFLTATSPRGVTLVEATGGYTHENRQVLICALKDSELPEFQKKILAIDETAFIIYSESQQIVGNGFYIYG